MNAAIDRATRRIDTGSPRAIASWDCIAWRPQLHCLFGQVFSKLNLEKMI